MRKSSNPSVAELTEHPREIESGVRPRVTLTSVAIATVACLGLNMVLVAIGMRPPRRDEDEFFLAKREMVDQAASATDDPVQWLVLGDSSAAFGFDPVRFNERTRQRAVNAATFGSLGLWGDVWMLERFIAAGGGNDPPPTVVMIHAADVWTGGYEGGFYQYAAGIDEPDGPSFRRILAGRPGGQDLRIWALHRGWLPITQLKTMLRRSTPPSKPAPLHRDGRRLLSIDRANPSSVESAVAAWRDRSDESANLDDRHVRALQRIIGITRRHSMPLIIANGPIAEPVTRTASFQKRVGVIEHRVREIARQHPHVHYLDRWIAFPPEVMENENHVVAPAAIRYTDRLIGHLQTADRLNLPVVNLPDVNLPEVTLFKQDFSSVASPSDPNDSVGGN